MIVSLEDLLLYVFRERNIKQWIQLICFHMDSI